jgi:hypothetical protein
MLRFAADAILSFSSAPVRFIMYLAVLLWVVSLAYVADALISHFVYQQTVQDGTTLAFCGTYPRTPLQ